MTLRDYRSLPEKIGSLLNIIALTAIAAIMFFPFYYIIVASFAPYTEYVQSSLLLWPKHWVLDSYHYILAYEPFIHSIFVSIYITVLGTLINLLLTSTMAYALTRNITGQRFYLVLVLFTFVFSGGMIPTYMVVKWTGLINTLWALMIPVAISPFNLIVIRQFIKSIPKELTESALIDGANDLDIYARIILPLAKPALAAFGLFSAVTLWNTYFTALLYLPDAAKWPVQVVLRQIVILNQTPQVANVARQALMSQHPPAPETIGMAAILIATIPILLAYPFLQKYFVKGVIIGSVKG